MDTPLVSCIMPTANRRRWAGQAIRYFQRQSYPNRELLILDDGADCIADLVPDDLQIRYVRAPAGLSLGAKRNECVALSRGDLIMHWDDDDWMSPDRIVYQVSELHRQKAEVCGLARMLFFEMASSEIWLYQYPSTERPWLAGGSLLYTRDFWKRSPFPDVQIASDTYFIWNRELIAPAYLDDHRFYVATIHPGNTSHRERGSIYWTRVLNENAPSLFGADFAFYTEPLLTVVIGVRAAAQDHQRLRNALACLRSFNAQDIERWRYRVVVVEQDTEPRLEAALRPFVDRYIFSREDGPYNRSRAFNVGALEAESGILCLSDADLFVPPDFVRRGMAAFARGARALLPYREVLYLDNESTGRVVRDGIETSLTGLRYSESQGGCIWVDADLYHRIGGHDERFKGWGREDREFWNRLEKATRIERLPGCLLHLDHPPANQNEWIAANMDLYDQIAKGEPKLREWENWHTWENQRIEAIVDRERNEANPAESLRGRLAAVLVSLGGTILDVGCGPGAMWPHLQDCLPMGSWAGVDVTHKMAVTAHHLFPGVPVYQGCSGSLPFRSGGFDVVLLRHVLEHLPEWLMEKALDEATRVASKAVVVSFFLAPMRDGQRETVQASDHFLETRWSVHDIVQRVERAQWRLRDRTMQCAGGESNEIWILQPAS